MTGNEKLHIDGNALPNATIAQFWAWSSSNLLSNTLRGIFGEYIVASALGINMKEPRKEWQTCDFDYEGYKIEVKTSAYLQEWNLTHETMKISNISFRIAPTKALDSFTGSYEKESKRHADVYVFCVLTCQDAEKIDPLNMNQWDFYVVSTQNLHLHLHLHLPEQKSISLTSLAKIPEVKNVKFGLLKENVDKALGIIAK